MNKLWRFYDIRYGFIYRHALIVLTVTLAFAPMGHSNEILTNPDFEDGTAGWNFWSGWGKISASSSPVRSGNGSFKITGESSGAQAFQSLGLEGGKEYVLTGWAYMDEVTPINNVFLGIWDNQLAGYYFKRDIINGPYNTWVQFGPYQFTTPTTLGSHYVQLGGFGSGGVVYWDGLSLQDDIDPNATPTPTPTPEIIEISKITKDWYREFSLWYDGYQLWSAQSLDGGNVAWGDSGYSQRMFINLYETFGETYWLDRMVIHVDTIIGNYQDTPHCPPHCNGTSDYVDGYQGLGQSRYTQYTPNYTEWFVDDGLHMNPILLFVELIWNTPSLHSEYKAKADTYLEFVEEVIIDKWYQKWAPDPGWSPDGDGARANDGYHLYEWAGWKNQPLNMFLSFTDGLMTLQRLVDSPFYTPFNPAFPAFYDDKADEMMEHYHDQMRYQASDDLYEWNYGPNTAWPTLIEDVGHAFIDLQAAIQGVQNRLYFTETDLQRIANTFVTNVWNGSLTNPFFRYYVDGKPNGLDASRGFWGYGFLYLAEYDYRIWEAMASYFTQNVNVRGESPFIAVTAAMLAIAAEEQDQWPPEVPRDLELTEEANDVLLSWLFPQTDADGTPLTGLAGFHVYKSKAGKTNYERITVNPLKVTNYRDNEVVNQGPWSYFVTAVDYRRDPINESLPSVVVTSSGKIDSGLGSLLMAY